MSCKCLYTQNAFSSCINADKNVELLQEQKLTKQEIEGTSWMLGQSVLTSWKGCMGSQAVYRSPSETIWHSCSFDSLWSSYRCPLHRCPSWKCLASLLLSLRQWLPPRSTDFSRFHTSYCLMWSPAPLEGGSHGTFSKEWMNKSRTKESEIAGKDIQEITLQLLWDRF